MEFDVGRGNDRFQVRCIPVSHFVRAALKQRIYSHPERKKHLDLVGLWLVAQGTQRALSVFQRSAPVRIGFCPNGNSLGWIVYYTRVYTADYSAYSALGHWLSLVPCRLPGWLLQISYMRHAAWYICDLRSSPKGR